LFNKNVTGIPPTNGKDTKELLINQVKWK